MTPWLSRRALLVVLVNLACGPGKADTDSATATDSSSTGTGGTGSSTTSDTSGISTTGAPTTGPGDPTTTGPDPGDDPCEGEWELPAAVTADLHINVVDADASEVFDPGIVYPDGTPAACIKWDGDKLGGVRLAFGPAVGQGPESLLQVVVSDGERIYGTSSFPPEPGAYDGIDVLYTFTSAPGQSQTFDYVGSQGIGELDAQWVGKGPGEHITVQAKLTMPNDGTGADVGFTIDAIIAPDMGPTVDFCETLDTPNKCLIAGCARWFDTLRFDDLARCSSTPVGYCAAEVFSFPPGTDTAVFGHVDGVAHLVRIGSEGCHAFGDEFPSHWTECGPGNSQPECDCACVENVCPGDDALATLEACGLPQPCPDLDSDLGEWDPADDCFFQALVADAPAVLRTHVNLGDPDLDDRVYLRGDGTADWLHGECDVSCVGSCDDRDWGVPRRCILRDSTFFTDCAAAVDQAELAECHDPANWFSDCQVTPPACP